MSKYIILLACIVVYLCAGSFGAEYRAGYATVVTDVEPAYAQTIAANAEAFIKGLSSGYFKTSGVASLTVYYAKDPTEAGRLLVENGHKRAAGDGWYIRGAGALYAYPNGRGKENTWEALFGGIATHFIYQNDAGAPVWFKAGLRRFFGRQGRIEKGRIVIGEPAPGGQAALKKVIDEGGKLTVTRLATTTDEQFDSWEAGGDFAQSLFHWLYENGFLEQYISATRGGGYDVAVLEEVTSKPVAKINVELLRFGRSVLEAGDLVTQGLASEDPNERKKCFSDALELRPNYQGARLELAKCYYNEKDFPKCRELLAGIMGASEPVEYRQAAQWTGASFAAQKDYRKAIEYYTNAWETSTEYECRYRLAYQIATCYYHLEDEANAVQWYRKFVDSRWDAGDWTQQADFARQYLELHEKAAPSATDSNDSGQIDE